MLFQEFTYKDYARVSREEGRMEGRMEGREEGYKNVAIKMIKANKSDFEILEMTELSLNEVKKLRERYA